MHHIAAEKVGITAAVETDIAAEGCWSTNANSDSFGLAEGIASLVGAAKSIEMESGLLAFEV